MMDINGTEVLTEWDKEEFNEQLDIIFTLLKLRGLIPDNCFCWGDVEIHLQQFEQFKKFNEQQKEQQ